jgi:uncharacterized integral membrane protein
MAWPRLPCARAATLDLGAIYPERHSGRIGVATLDARFDASEACPICHGIHGAEIPPEERTAMRWIHLSVVMLFVAFTLVFSVQNLEIVTMSFLSFNVRAPLALIIAVFYLLGMATGSSLWALLRRSIEASRRPA